MHEVRKNVYVCFQLPAELVEMLVADTELLKKVPEMLENTNIVMRVDDQPNK